VAPTTPKDALVRKRLREFFNGSPDFRFNLVILLWIYESYRVVGNWILIWNSKVERQSKHPVDPKFEGMQLRRPDQSERWRVAVFVAVVGLHFLVGVIILATGTIRMARLRAVESPLSLLSLARESPPKPSSPPPAIDAQNIKNREPPRDADRLPRAEPAPNAITLPLDLSTEAAVRRQSDREEDEIRRRDLAGPSESQLQWWKDNAPLARDHLSGNSEKAEGGELIAWINDKCYFTTQGITTFGLPQTNRVCKDPPKPETELFKDMRKQLDERSMARAP
jgi:hypothetical protein